MYLPISACSRCRRIASSRPHISLYLPCISAYLPHISQADRELKVRLEATQAELASTRKVLDEARFSKDEQLAAVQRTHELQKQQLLHAAANAREANLFRYEPYSMTLTLTLFRDPNPIP